MCGRRRNGASSNGSSKPRALPTLRSPYWHAGPRRAPEAIGGDQRSGARPPLPGVRPGDGSPAGTVHRFGIRLHSRAGLPAPRIGIALPSLYWRPLAALRLRPSNAWDDGSASLQDGSLAAASSRAQRPGPSGEAARRRPRGAGRRDLERAALMPEEGEGRAASQFRGRGPFDRNDGCATEWQTTLGEAHS